MNEGRYAGVIGQGGLLLARIPEEIALQIDAYYRKQNEAKEEAVENNLMKEQHPSMIIKRIEYSCNLRWYKEKLII